MIHQNYGLNPTDSNNITINYGFIFDTVHMMNNINIFDMASICNTYTNYDINHRFYDLIVFPIHMSYQELYLFVQMHLHNDAKHEDGKI